MQIWEFRMSHSENDIEGQKQRHKGPLIGYAVVAILVLATVIWWATSEMRGPQVLPDENAPAATSTND